MLNHSAKHDEKPIDFVIIWVDGSDPSWRLERDTWLAKESDGITPGSSDAKKLTHTEIDNSDHRYRDWDNLRYWFRGVETFAPWVRKVHFVTWGHLPSWLNTKNPKLNIVNHRDYMPERYLPTFSSHAIELNLHRIKGLSDQFVYFNDDMFLLKPMEPKDFFQDGKPCDAAIMNVHCYDMDEMFVLAPFRDIGVINRHFKMKDVLRENWGGWFNPAYGSGNLRNLILLPCPRFPGILQGHLPASYLKSTFEEVWAAEPELLDEASSHRFREIVDVNQWVMKEWQLAQNNFCPRSPRVGESIPAYHLEDACTCIAHQRSKMLCFNDTPMDDATFQDAVARINASFQGILPDKSGFEL